ncbi:MAG: aspartate ammonia-lyase, partial [Bacteroidia bacterium]|nr:aspartate ammonia-lyase [Bacteroidia bacterium]
LGYEACSAIAKEALESGKSVHDIAVVEKKLVTQEKWDEIFNLENLIHPKFINK